MKLYQFPWGVYPRRVLVYLAERRVNDLEIIDVDVIAGENRKPEFLAKNPLGTMPLLEIGVGKYIRQSSAIIEYFEEQSPSPGLMGKTLEERIATREQMSAIHDAYLAAQFFTYYASPLMAQRRTQSAEAADATWNEYRITMTSLESFAGEAPFLGGETPSVADIMFFASAQFYETLYRVRVPESCVRLKRIYANFSRRPSAAPPRYPEAIVSLAPVTHPQCANG